MVELGVRSPGRGCNNGQHRNGKYSARCPLSFEPELAKSSRAVARPDQQRGSHTRQPRPSRRSPNSSWRRSEQEMGAAVMSHDQACPTRRCPLNSCEHIDLPCEVPRVMASLTAQSAATVLVDDSMAGTPGCFRAGGFNSKRGLDWHGTLSTHATVIVSAEGPAIVHFPYVKADACLSRSMTSLPIYRPRRKIARIHRSMLLLTADPSLSNSGPEPSTKHEPGCISVCTYIIRCHHNTRRSELTPVLLRGRSSLHSELSSTGRLRGGGLPTCTAGVALSRMIS